MPLNQDRVEAGISPINDTVICCKHCHRPADWTNTIGQNDALLYELSCPINGPDQARTLGQWNSAEERAADIRGFLAAQLCQCHHSASDHPHGHCEAILDRLPCPCGQFTLHR